LTQGRPAQRRCYAAACGEYPAQNLWAKWGQLFRRFPLPNLGQRHFPLCEASLLSKRTIESPFIPFLFSLLFFCGKIGVSFSVLLPERSLPPASVPLRISPEKQIARSHHGAT
jgi:hypothetical protein